MSPFAIVIVVIILFCLFKVISSSAGQNNATGAVRGGRPGARPSATRMPTRKPPECLGVPEGHPARTAAERLEAALTADFEARVKDRVLRNTPSLRDGDWQWRWFELKRYFLMCGILRGVPMYGARVDDVWHEMLMFTREYEQFCKQFCGALIHHAPHAPGGKPDPGERAWFDWIYGELFLPAPASGQLWGPFYRTPMPHELMRELEQDSDEALRTRKFNERAAEQFPDIDATVRYLIERGRMLAASTGQEQSHRDRDDWTTTGMSTGLLSGMFFASSWGPADDFHNQMDDAQSVEEREANGDNTGTGYVCSSNDSNDDGGNGDDSGGSSCSSDSGSNCSSGDSGSGGDSGGGSSCGSSCGGSS
ncbi:glycine-rich domain-containing protein [Paenibacillus albus]|uniref:Uncharacterized protein n=1 Tax=Paenibacillus albus TaxID=2495582 RepID=A0A3S8ZYT5_9BACL|nr:hypothetical protein [Paenibacillus albus]AZN38615.1 hypothetical protein EJC50_02180 [Paenibacillus albus]